MSASPPFRYPVPVAGWYDDPQGAPQLRYWDGVSWTPHIAAPPVVLHPAVVTHPAVAPGPRLDAAVYAMKADDEAPWGWRPVVLPIAAFVAVIIAGQLVSDLVNPQSYNSRVAFAIVATFLAEATLGLMVWLAGRDIAHRYGGWGRAFGLRHPRWIDLGFGALAFVGVLVAEIMLGVIANGITHGRASHEAQNVHLDVVSAPAIILLFVGAVVCAPLIEEMVFRGLLLRTFMRRFTFWPSALLSTAIFGLFHTYEVNTVAGAITLALNVSCLGLANCILNRYTDRLAAGMGVHAAINLLALTIVIAQAAH